MGISHGTSLAETPGNTILGMCVTTLLVIPINRTPAPKAVTEKEKPAKAKAKVQKEKSGKGGKSDDKGHGNSHPSGGPYLCIKCGDVSHFRKDCQCRYNRAYYSYMKEMIDKSRVALEQESSELCVQERLFGKTFVAKNDSRYEVSFDPKESVLTTGWDPATAPADLIAFATSRSRGFCGAIPFTRKDLLFIFVTVIFVFKTKSYANAFANHVNEHASGDSWSFGEPVLAWIPERGTIESIVAGVDASRDICIQEWAKSQNSSSDESANGSNDNDKRARRKKTKQKHAEDDTSSKSDDDHGDISHKKTTNRKHAASSSVGKELTQDAGPIKSPKKEAKTCAPKQDAKHVRIAMDVDEESAHESVASSDSLELIKTDASRTNPVMKNTDNLIHKTIGHAMAQVRNQFEMRSHRIDGLEKDVKGNMRMTKEIGGKLDNHLMDLPRQYKGLADDIVVGIDGRKLNAVDEAVNCISSPTLAPQPTRKIRGPHTVVTGNRVTRRRRSAGPHEPSDNAARKCTLNEFFGP